MVIKNTLDQLIDYHGLIFFLIHSIAELGDMDDTDSEKMKGDCFFNFEIKEIVTLMPRFPFSEKCCATPLSNTRQSEFNIAEEIPS